MVGIIIRINGPPVDPGLTTVISRQRKANQSIVIKQADKWKNARNTIEFDPARPISGWVVFKSSADLPLLLSFRDTVPYIHGVKVLINLGNPTSITYLGFKVHAQWGQRRQDFAGDLGQWKSSLKEIVIDIDNNLLPGSKNRFSLFLPRTKFKEAYFLTLDYFF